MNMDYFPEDIKPQQDLIPTNFSQQLDATRVLKVYMNINFTILLYWCGGIERFSSISLRIFHISIHFIELLYY